MIPFLNYRIAKLRPPLSARWLKIGMVTCWLVACALALTLNLGWLARP
jgi:hypothetical protein